MITPDQQKKSVVAQLEKLQNSFFWGQFVLRFRQGGIYMMEIHETIPMDNIADSEDRKKG